jgi:hypothetical protein
VYDFLKFFEKSADKISTRTKTEDDSALDKSQKRRRQLPSIPAALGESPETTRPKSSIELSSTKERSDLSPILECKVFDTALVHV